MQELKVAAEGSQICEARFRSEMPCKMIHH